MGDQTEYVELLSLVVDFHDHAVTVSSDFEGDPVTGNCAGRRVAFGYLRGHLPLCAFCIAEPGLQGAAGVGMFLPEFVKSALEQNAQGRTDVPLYIIIINVPNMNDYTTFPIGRQDAEVYFGGGGRDCPGAAVVTGVQPFQIGGGTGHPQGVPLRGIGAGWRIWGRGRSRRSEGHVGVGVAGGEGVVVGEDHVFGAVGAEGGFVVAADDGEGVEDVGGVVF